MTNLLTPEATTGAVTDPPVTPTSDGSSGHPNERTGTSPIVSIVIPAHNEQHNMEPLVRELHDVRGHLPDSEIIFVDDGSTDQTLTELRRMKRECIADLRIIRHNSSVGQSTAILSGIRAARGQLIVTLDADGQNPPSDIPVMVNLALAQPSGSHFCIAGHRFQRQDTRWKKVQSRIANAIRRAILRDGTPDTGCALKVIPRETWLRLPCFDHMHRFLPALIQRVGGQIIVQKVSHRPRQHDESKYAMSDRLGAGIVDLAGMLWLGRRTRLTQVSELIEEQD